VIVSRVLASVLFASTGTEPGLITAAVAMLGVAAAVASYVPARRAIHIDLVAALRAE
jgi:ABC-type lipoprotein release transport system permease subunit